MKLYIKSFILFFFVPALLLLLLFLNIPSISSEFDNNIHNIYERESNRLNVCEIVEGVTVKQIFECKSDSISAVDFFATTLSSQLTKESYWTLELYDEESNEKLMSKKINILLLRVFGKTRTLISLPKVKGVKGKLLSLVIKSDSPQGENAAIVVVDTDKEISTRDMTVKELIINGKKERGNIYFNLWYDSSPNMLLIIEGSLLLLCLFWMFISRYRSTSKLNITVVSNKYSNSLIIFYILSFIFLISFTVSRLVWPLVHLPFKNPLEAVGPLALRGFNPSNNILRYIIFVSLPSVFFLLLYCSFPRLRKLLLFGSSTAEDEPNEEAVNNEFFISDKLKSALKIISLSILFLWGASSVLLFFMEKFIPTHLDFFHDGELLTPAFNYITTGGLWKSSYFIHGAFYDPFTPILGWELFGYQTIGSFRMSVLFLEYLIPIGMLFFFLVITDVSAKKNEYLNKIILLQLMILTYISFSIPTFPNSPNSLYDFLNRRDLPVLLGMSFLLLALNRKNMIFGFIAGLFSAASYFYTIDRGAYYTAALLSVLVISYFFTDDKSKSLKIIKASLLGVLCGWIIFWIGVGHEEFKAFLNNTLLIYRSKDLFDSYVYHTPELQTGSLVYVLPMICIGMQILGAVFFILKDYIKGKELHLVPIHSSFVLLSFFYFRSGLGRSSSDHVVYASSFAFIGLTFLLWLVIRNLKSKHIIISILVFLIGFNSYYVFKDVKKLSFATIIEAPLRIREYVRQPDYKFLTPNESSIINKLKKIFKDEPCISSFTNDAVLPYLLKKPSCGEFFVVWFASPRPNRDKIIADIKKYSPRYIVFKSISQYNSIDGIPNKVRFPDVYDFVLRNYALYENVDGVEIYKRINEKVFY
jgi:hypothetical protein